MAKAFNHDNEREIPETYVRRQLESLTLASEDKNENKPSNDEDQSKNLSKDLKEVEHQLLEKRNEQIENNNKKKLCIQQKLLAGILDAKAQPGKLLKGSKETLRSIQACKSLLVIKTSDLCTNVPELDTILNAACDGNKHWADHDTALFTISLSQVELAEWAGQNKLSMDRESDLVKQYRKRKALELSRDPEFHYSMLQNNNCDNLSITSSIISGNGYRGSTCCCLVIQRGVQSQNIEDCLDFYRQTFPDSTPRNKSYYNEKSLESSSNTESISSSSSSSKDLTSPKMRKKHLKQKLRERRNSNLENESPINIFKDSYRKDKAKKSNYAHNNKQEDLIDGSRKRSRPKNDHESMSWAHRAKSKNL